MQHLYPVQFTHRLGTRLVSVFAFIPVIPCPWSCHWWLVNLTSSGDRYRPIREAASHPLLVWLRLCLSINSPLPNFPYGSLTWLANFKTGQGGSKLCQVGASFFFHLVCSTFHPVPYYLCSSVNSKNLNVSTSETVSDCHLIIDLNRTETALHLLTLGFTQKGETSVDFCFSLRAPKDVS